MEQEISEYVRRELRRCANLDIFMKQGYDIEEGEISVKQGLVLMKLP